MRQFNPFILFLFIFVHLLISSPQVHATNLESLNRLPLPPEKTIERLNELKYTPWNGKFLERIVNLNSPCKISRATIEIEDPKTKEKQSLLLRLILPKTSEAPPAMILVPSIDGITILEPTVSARLCANGIATIIADINDTSLPKDLPAWDHEDKVNRKAIISLRTIVDFATQSPLFDHEKIGLFGTSLGGINAAFMAGIEPDRLKALVIVVGGGDLPHALATGNSAKISRLRSRRMLHEKITSVDEYEKILNQSVRYDPIYFAAQAKPENIFMAIGAKDRTVPYICQKTLHEAFGNPEYMVFNSTHIPSVIKTVLFSFHKIVDFLRRRLEFFKLNSLNEEETELQIDAIYQDLQDNEE